MKFLRCHVSFPLTPALSLGERENCSTLHSIICGWIRRTRIGKAGKLRSPLPFHWGGIFPKNSRIEPLQPQDAQVVDLQRWDSEVHEESRGEGKAGEPFFCA